MDLGLKDSAAVVTGGSKGMGRAIAEAFADDGDPLRVAPASEPRISPQLLRSRSLSRFPNH